MPVMTLDQVIQCCGVVALVAIALGLWRVAKAIRSTPSATPGMLKPSLSGDPEERQKAYQAQVNALIEATKEAVAKREQAKAERQHRPPADNTRPGRYVMEQ